MALALRMSVPLAATHPCFLGEGVVFPRRARHTKSRFTAFRAIRCSIGDVGEGSDQSGTPVKSAKRNPTSTWSRVEAANGEDYGGWTPQLTIFAYLSVWIFIRSKHVVKYSVTNHQEQQTQLPSTTSKDDSEDVHKASEFASSSPPSSNQSTKEMHGQNPQLVVDSESDVHQKKNSPGQDYFPSEEETVLNDEEDVWSTKPVPVSDLESDKFVHAEVDSKAAAPVAGETQPTDDGQKAASHVKEVHGLKDDVSSDVPSTVPRSASDLAEPSPDTAIFKESAVPSPAEAGLSWDVSDVHESHSESTVEMKVNSKERDEPGSLVMDESEDYHGKTSVLQDTVPSPSGRWTDDDSAPYVILVRNGGVYSDVGGKGRGNAQPIVDFWGNKTATAGRAERGTLTRIKATRRGSLGSVDDVDNEWPQRRSGGWKDDQMSQGQVRRRDSADGAGQKTTKQYTQDEPELWDNDALIDDSVSSRRSTGGSQNYEESEQVLNFGRVPVGDRESSYGGRGSRNRMIKDEEDYRNGRNPDRRHYSQERTRSNEDDAQMLSEEEEEDFFGNDSRSWVSDDVGASRNGGDLRGDYSPQARMSPSSKVPINSGNRRQRLVDNDGEDTVEEDDRYRVEPRNLDGEEEDFVSERRGVKSQYPSREVQSGSDYDSEAEGENIDLPSYVQSEIEVEERNLPVRQPSRIQLEKFDRLLDKGEALLEEGMQGLEGRIEVGVAERMLYEAANLFEAAFDIDPSSLIAVGFWGNTLLVHGELKLKLSQQLRSMLPSSNSYSMARARAAAVRDYQRESLELTLQNVCEECEELLVDAGRKYRMALSLDRTDMRALYNWGLALCYRGQLIADEGGEKAIQDADKVYLAAIDKFEAMLGISQDYAPGALYNWGLAMRDRARLRPMGDRDRVKLLLQAKELFQDSVRLDPNNGQARGAVTAAVAELQELKRFEERQSAQGINERSSKGWWE